LDFNSRIGDRSALGSRIIPVIAPRSYCARTAVARRSFKEMSRSASSWRAWDPRRNFAPLSDENGPSIMKAVRDHCQNQTTPGRVLVRALGYDTGVGEGAQQVRTDLYIWRQEPLQALGKLQDGEAQNIAVDRSTVKVDIALKRLKGALDSDSGCLNFLRSGIAGNNPSVFNAYYNALSGASGGPPLAGAAEFSYDYATDNAITGFAPSSRTAMPL